MENAENTEDIESGNRNLAAAIEAILFSVGDAVSVKELAKVLEAEENEVSTVIEFMVKEYEEEKRGIKIIKLEDAYQLCTKQEYYDYLIKLVNMPKKHVLTDALMETLSIVAYKQPITRQEIEAIRGVSCVHAINKLVEYKLIGEVGRLDAVGRPILFGTTEDFMRSFGVTSLDELPVITPDKIEDFRKEAMEEANVHVET
ncbi:MAG: SMC-Scp complex subunit ScpB [Lachnospiraceae bacterium]|nr:SMC-Scp complex subunit ScpB [Lachnospiraceae bacterium]